MNGPHDGRIRMVDHDIPAELDGLRRSDGQSA